MAKIPRGSLDLAPGFPVYDIKFTEDGQNMFLVGGGGSGNSGVKNLLIRYKKTDNGSAPWERLYDMDMGKDGAPMNIALHPEHKVLIVGVNEKSKKIIYSTNGFELGCTIITNTATDDGWQRAVAFSPDGQHFITGGTETIPRMWKYAGQTKQNTDTLEFESKGLHTKDVVAVAFHTNGTQFFACSNDAISLWSREEKTLVLKLESETLSIKGNKKCFRDLCMSPDPNAPFFYTLETSSKGAYISRRDSETLKPEQTSHVYHKPCTRLVTSPQGSLLALGTSDGSVFVYLSRTLRCIHRIRGCHAFPVTCLAFNYSKSRPAIASASADWACYIHPIDPAKVRRMSRGSGKIPFIAAFIFITIILGIYALLMYHDVSQWEVILADHLKHFNSHSKQIMQKVLGGSSFKEDLKNLRNDEL